MATFAGIGWGVTATLAAGAAPVPAAVAACAVRVGTARPAANAVARTSVRFMWWLLLLRDRELGVRKFDFMEWELRHSPGSPARSIAGVATLRVLLSCRSHLKSTGERGAGRCCGADCTKLYKTRSMAGQTTNEPRVPAESRSKSETFASVDRFTCYRTRLSAAQSPDKRSISFRKAEPTTLDSPILGRQNSQPYDFVTICGHPNFGTPIALSPVFDLCVA